MCFVAGPDPGNPQNRPEMGAPGPPRYRRTVQGNHWISKFGWGTGWPPSGCPGQNANFKYTIPSEASHGYRYPEYAERFIGGGEFRIPNCHEMSLELVCGADFWCNRHCRTSPVVLKGFWGQVWPKISRKPEKSEYRIANETAKFIGCYRCRGRPKGTVSLDLWFRGPLEAKSFVRAPKSTLPGPREGSSILNAHLVVVTAAFSLL